MTSLHEKLCLFTVQAYLEGAVRDGLTNERLHKDIIAGIERYRTMRCFSSEELQIAVDLGKTDHMEDLKSREISFVVYALELLRLVSMDYKILIGVSKKERLRGGKATFVFDMLERKRKDPESYKDLKIIIDESVVNAGLFYSYTMEQLNGKLKYKSIA